MANIKELGDLHLSENETAVMNVIWDSAKPLTVPELIAELIQRQVGPDKTPVIPTTIDATVRRLRDRGILQSKRIGTRSVVWSAKSSRVGFFKQSLVQIREKIFGVSATEMLPNLTGRTKDAATASEVQELLDELSRLAAEIPPNKE